MLHFHYIAQHQIGYIIENETMGGKMSVLPQRHCRMRVIRTELCWECIGTRLVTSGTVFPKQTSTEAGAVVSYCNWAMPGL